MARHIVLTLVGLALMVSPALGDDIHLTNGGTLEGKARRVGDEVIVTTGSGEVRFPAKDVLKIVPGKTRMDEYEERAANVDAKDADALVALGDWCQEKRLTKQAKEHWRAALRLDGEQKDARERLGFIKYQDRWVTGDEYRRLRGFVKVHGEWVHKDELARRERQQEERRKLAAHKKKIDDCVKRMSSMKRKPRLLAKLELQEYAESIGDMKLASFASDVADYYNRAWTEVKRSLVKMEVRATHSQLKRPIDTIDTSLGAGTNPVKIQLPELAIVQVKTTVIVPADIELDDE